MIRMIATDLDGTLLRSDKTISDYTVGVFGRVRKHGVLLAFATARSLESSREYRDMLNPDGDIVTGDVWSLPAGSCSAATICLYRRGRLCLRNCKRSRPSSVYLPVR